MPARLEIVLLLDVFMAAGLRRNLVLPESAGCSTSRSAARAGCQQTGIHTVGDFLEILRMRIEDQTAVAGMNLFHDLEPDFRRIAAVQTIQTVVMLVALPRPPQKYSGVTPQNQISVFELVVPVLPAVSTPSS